MAKKNYNVTALVNHLHHLDDLGIPTDHYTICQSGILALMGIRMNDDIDIVISSELRKYLKSTQNYLVTHLKII